MAWTQQDVTDLEVAIKALATGAKSYAVNGRSCTREDLANLRELRTSMMAELGGKSICARGVYDDSAGGG